MSQPDPTHPLPPDDAANRRGEYVLGSLLRDGGTVRRWVAEQASVGRTVLIDELRPDRAEKKDEFLATARAQAGASHPLIGAVYEAVSGEDGCWCALELLPGASLAERLEAGEAMAPAQLAYAIRRIAQANEFLENGGHATRPCTPAAVRIDDNGVVRLENPAVSGKRDPGESLRDIRRIGADLRPLVAENMPGSTRMATLTEWMANGVEGRWLSWKDVIRYCEQIEHQLAESAPALAAPMTPLQPQKNPAWSILIPGAVILLGIALLLLQLANRRPPRPLSATELGTKAAIPAGVHKLPDGSSVELPAFRLAAYEVTIREYRDFLDAVAHHAREGNPRIFAHPEQPQEKSGHQPDDWDALLEAARTRGRWDGRDVSLDSPVTGVDWWDAHAYAAWQRARLPKQEEWLAALAQGGTDPKQLPAGPWQSLALETPDRTGNGLVGMAGSVCEWMENPSVPPDNPAGRPQWVLLGGSYLRPAGALAREWVESRSLRRPDTGFRLAFDPAP